VNKEMLIADVAGLCRVSEAAVRQIVDALFAPEGGVITAALRRGEPVAVEGFGTFTPDAESGISFRAWNADDDSATKPDPSTGSRRTAPSRPLWLGGAPTADVQFTTYHPREIVTNHWYALLAYVHLPEMADQIEQDSHLRLGKDAHDYGSGRGRRTSTIKQGAEISVMPELPGCRFNPPRALVTWLKDWHRVEFEVRCEPDTPGYVEDEAVNGRIAFYVGPVLVGEAKIWAHISSNNGVVRRGPRGGVVPIEPYRRIFVSYSHEDAKVVHGLEAAYKALGDVYFRDVRSLRSGELWNPALLRMIEQADVFQLCWSEAAKRSDYVKREWMHALTLSRPTPFVRPTYWQTPMPEPPIELQGLQFSRLEI